MYFFAGHLSAVTDLHGSVQASTISLSWTPPFTLNIASENPDIVGYWVGVMNSSSFLLHSCEINETGFSFILADDSGCQEYIFHITPVNVVGNGTLATFLYYQALEG